MEENQATVEEFNPEIAQTERIGLGDLIIAALLAASVFLFAGKWSFSCVLPSVWNDAVIASGVRPATTVIAGFWRFLGSYLYDACGVNGAGKLLVESGHLSLTLLAIIAYAVFRELLAFVMRARPQFSRRRTTVMQLASVVGAIAFVCADPVWSAGQCFSETTGLLLLSLAALEFYFVFLRKGTLKYAYLCAILVGLLSAETPMGLLLGGVFIGIYAFILKVMPVLESPFFKPAVIAVGKWHITFFFMAALIGGIALNCHTYIAEDGLTAIGASVGDIPLAYLKGYWQLVASAGDVLGWLLLVGAALAPFIVTLVRFPAAADEEQFLPYPTGIVFLVCGVVAAAQSAALPALWFWTYGEIGSQYLLSIGCFLCALTLAGSVTILGVDALCRNHRRLAKQVFGADDAEGEPTDDEAVEAAQSRSVKFLRLGGLALVPSVIVLAIVPGRIKDDTREMLDIIGEYVRTVVDEAGDAEYLFTDGNLDAAVELESARRGGTLKCISLLSGDDEMSVYLRTRGMEADKEDLFSFTHDGGMGLRTWMRDKPKRLAQSAVQIGFDLWKRDGKAIPEVGGLLSRPGKELAAEGGRSTNQNRYNSIM